MVLTKHSILKIRLLTKSEHMTTQVVALSFPFSAAYARNAWDHDPPFGVKTRAFLRKYE